MIKVWVDVLEKQDCELEAKIEFSILDYLEEKGVALPYGCRAGSCGSCRVQIVEGMDLLNAVGAMEKDTLERCEDDASVRLACRARFRSEGLKGTLRIQKAKEL